MKPSKPFALRVPMRQPPSPDELKQKKLRLMKMRRLEGNESGEQAYQRAMRTMPWGERIADGWPYFSSSFWIFMVRGD